MILILLILILKLVFNIEHNFCKALARYLALKISDVSDQGDKIRYWRVLSQSVPGPSRWEIWLDLLYRETGRRTFAILKTNFSVVTLALTLGVLKLMFTV